MDDDDGDLKHRWATWGLVGLNVLVFLAMLFAGASPLYASYPAIAAGGVEPSLVWDGQLWRLFVANFVHLGIWHVALNVWVLWQLGRALERLVGGSRLLLIYLASGVFGFALSLGLRAVPTAGASGAVFGVTGGLLAIALLLKHKELGKVLLQALVPFVGATFLLGFLVDFIDNTAHLGGLLFGLLLGYGLCAGDHTLSAVDADGAPSPSPSTLPLADDERERREKLWGLVALLACAALFVVVVGYAARPFFSPRYHAAAGLADLRVKRLDQAKEHAALAARYGKEDAATFVLLGRRQQEVATTDQERAAAHELLREALRRFEGDTTNARFERALQSLALFGGDDLDLPFRDHRTVNALCEAALDDVAGVPLSTAPATSAPAPAAGRASGQEEGVEMLLNQCAWLKLKSADAGVHDPADGLALAQQAVAASTGQQNAAILHTLAEALSQNGEADEGLAILEKLAAQGRAGELPGGEAWLLSERRRIARIADDRVGSP